MGAAIREQASDSNPTQSGARFVSRHLRIAARAGILCGHAFGHADQDRL